MKPFVARLILLASLVGLVGCISSEVSLDGYWDGLSLESVVADVEVAEQRFCKWTELVAKAEPQAQDASIEALVEVLESDRVLSLVVGEWATNYLYGIGSPQRNQLIYRKWLMALDRSESIPEEDKSYVGQHLGYINHNDAGQRVEEFALTNRWGESVAIGDYLARPTLLLMIDTTCPSCVDMMQSVEECEPLRKAQQKGVLEWVLVAMGQSPESIAPLDDQKSPLGWSVFSAPRGLLEECHFDTSASPAMWLLDERGVVVVPMTRNVVRLADALKNL